MLPSIQHSMLVYDSVSLFQMNKCQWNSISLSSVCMVYLLVVQADIIKHAPVGQLFVHELNREVYQNEFEPFLKHYGKLY